MSNIHQRFVKNTRRLLAQQKLTAEQLALEIEKDKAHLSRVLSGKKKASLDLAELVAKALKVDVSDLFQR